MDVLRQLSGTFAGLSTARKGVFAATAGGAVALAILLYSWSSQTAFVTLYSALDPTDASRISDDLTAQGVPFELAGGGSTIRVPEAELDRLRMTFAAQGLPSGGDVGLELFDGISATDFMQRVNYQRGLQGELARSIETFASVEHARVHIVMPERSLFVAEERAATASVIVQLRPGRTLSQDQVGGIAHLVSGAVEGLDKQHITVVDIGGNVLFDGATLGEVGGVGSSATHLQQQQKFERDLERDVQSLLDRAVGTGRSAVKVSAALNFDEQETETESYVPNQAGQGTPRSNTTVTETYTTNGSGVVGAVPGAVANIPGANTSLTGADTTENAGTSYQRSENTSNFEMGKTVQRVRQAPGQLERLSVSLLLDDSIAEAQATDLQNAVAAAVGLDAARGDVIALSRLTFDKRALEEAQSAFASESSMDQYLGYGRLALPVVALIVGFIFFRMLLGAVSNGLPPAAAVATVGGGLRPLTALPGGAAELIARASTPALAAPPEETRSEVEVHVQTLAQGRPEAVAEVVQAWLREE